MPHKFFRKAPQRGSSLILDMLSNMIYKLGDVALLDASLYLLPRLSHALQAPRLTLLRTRYRRAVMMAWEYALLDHKLLHAQVTHNHC